MTIPVDRQPGGPLICDSCERAVLVTKICAAIGGNRVSGHCAECDRKVTELVPYRFRVSVVCMLCGGDGRRARWDKCCLECRKEHPPDVKLTVAQRDRRMVELRNTRGFSNKQIAVAVSWTEESVSGRFSALRARGRQVDIDPNTEPAIRNRSEEASKTRRATTRHRERVSV